ncbi:MAG: phosphoglucomutase [Desulfurococcales archaeon ex4484_58]|nr:MAG: phosphoglucomutase [Desulfurococcales archaeon ex4484_58]
MKLFGTAGIRMKYPEQLDPILAYKIGLASSSLKLARESYIVYDSRITNHLFTYSFVSGLLAGGVDSYIIGLAPTPIAAFSAKKYSGLGVSITASHNPPEYNGFKLYDPEGYEFTRDLERVIEERVEEGSKPVHWSSVGRVYFRDDIVEEYISELIDVLGDFNRRWEPFIVVDLANGAAGNVTPEIIRVLGGKPLTINANPDGFFPVRTPEPRKDALEKYLELYKSVNPAMILAHDGDADRLAVLDPVKGFIRQDRIIAYYAYLLLRDRRGRVVVSIDTGKVVDEVVERMGGSIERYLLGKTHERVKELGINNIVMAAEPWKLIDPRWGPWVDGIWQAALLTREVLSSGKPLIKILDELGIPDYPWDRRSYLIEPVELRDKIFFDMSEELKSLLGEPIEILDIDGYRYEYDDKSWILIRKSGTEPKIRVYMEAQRSGRLKSMIEAFENKLLEIIKKHGGRIVEKTIG